MLLLSQIDLYLASFLREDAKVEIGSEERRSVPRGKDAAFLRRL
ncbi:MULTISPECIES: hypothetical protein [unclassified Mesorhizobium]|nr:MULTISPECIES: hypothetical protein [unclassified Mesorhizobium]